MPHSIPRGDDYAERPLGVALVTIVVVMICFAALAILAWRVLLLIPIPGNPFVVPTPVFVPFVDSTN